MTAYANRRWVVADRPLGRELRDGDFRLEDARPGQPGEGEVLLQTLYLGFDPAQKSWIETAESYRGAIEIGETMRGSGVGQVLASNHAGFAPGDIVHGSLGWEEYPVKAGDSLAKVPDGVPITASLGVLGGTGRTAYVGLNNIGKPKPGDTLVISGAAGATGSVVGQIGRIAGCRVIGIAGGPEKCAWLVDELGFDGAVDYKDGKLRSRLRELCPRGIDVFWDNVGGDVLNDCLARLAVGARVVICGGISRYNADPRDPAQMQPGPRNYFNVVFTGATIQGFVMTQYERDFPVAEARLLDWVKSGAIRYREDVQHGFENAPATLNRLFLGQNFGKQLLKVADA